MPVYTDLDIRMKKLRKSHGPEVNPENASYY